MKKIIRLSVLFALGMLFIPPSVHAGEIFPTGSTWKYFIGTAEASNPNTAWRVLGFSDTAWSSGPTPIGYGEDQVTTLPTSTAGNYSTVYLRKVFSIANPANVAQLTLYLRIDDGCVVWINGTEVGRDTAPAGDLAFNALATAQIEPHDFTIIINQNLQTLLAAGDNVVAVQLLNGALSSSDIYLNSSLSFVEPDLVPPTLLSKTPAPGTLNTLNQITLVFSEAMANVDAGDLLINGVPASSVTGVGDTYSFFFGQPAFGTVQVSFSSGHGITDLGVPPNPFDHTVPAASWQYNLVDIFPPIVTSITPPAGNTVRALTNIQIQFSEPVSGVEPADLQINGDGAASMTMLTDRQFVFHFPEPPTGVVQVAWASGHGIQDMATVPNAFAGDMWQYLLDPNAASATLFITEFMSDNDNGLEDEDGDAEDWIEIYNSSDLVSELEGWYLTDDADDLTKWRFPATNIAAKSFMIIFASNKDRNTPGRPLHTNFQLDKEGAFLALVRPDGTIASAFAPLYPAQVSDVSYGLPTASDPTVWVSTGAKGRYLVPTSGALGTDWTLATFDDASWTATTNGIGFEGSPGTTPSLSGAFASDIQAAMRNVNSSVYFRLPFVVNDPSQYDILGLRMKHDDGYIAYINGAEVSRRNAFTFVARSTNDFSGVQGSNSWSYGYYNKTTDPDHTYASADFIPFPASGTVHNANNYWTGTRWDWYQGNPPWTEISIDGAHPNGSNNGNEHWAIRRYVSEATGSLIVRYRLAKSNTGGGNGVTGRIFHNGAEVFTKTIAFNDASNVTNEVRIVGVTQGDQIDFALDATGTDGIPNDGSDGSITTMTILHEQGLPVDWNIASTASRPDSQAIVFEDSDISGALESGITTGTNILAIQGLNSAVSDDDFLAVAELHSRTAVVLTNQARYFTAPTPGRPNGVGEDTLGPVLSEIDHDPSDPLDSEDLRVTIRVTRSFNPISTVTLRYRVMYGGEFTVAMTDSGQGADLVLGDGIYSGIIPASAASMGQMVRWYVQASDSAGSLTRFPPFKDAFNSPEYDGTVVQVAQTNNLPLLHVFIQNGSFAAAASDAGVRCSIYYLGEFYDNVNINNHGQSSRGFPKHSYDIDFHPGYNFKWKEGEDRVDDINLLTPYPDKLYMRNALSYETYRDAEGTYHFVENVRIHFMGVFEGVWYLVENGDDNWLDRQGLAPNGSLYKMYNTFTDTTDYGLVVNTEAEKKTRKNEGNQDLINLFTGMVSSNGVTATPQVYTNYMFDNMDVPATVNFLAARILTGDIDCCHKNYYFYRDSDQSGEWQGMAWDVDLSFGRNWHSTLSYWDNAMYPQNGLQVGGNNGVFSKFFSYQPTLQMYQRRIRTLMDELLQPNGTLSAALKYEARIDQLAEELRPDAALDLNKNGTWTTGSAGPSFNTAAPEWETLDEAILREKTYLTDRRAYLYGLSGGQLPTAQPANANILFGTLEVTPLSGNQLQEFVELRNTNNYAVDISGWQLAGAIQHTFRGGTVLPVNGRLYVSPDVKQFRARQFSPKVGEGRFVQGNYSGQLSSRGETLWLIHKDGRTNQTLQYIGNPSLPVQFLRITELMYHPPPPAGAMTANAEEDFEYIELRNTSPSTTLSLLGVRLINGVEFSFAGSAVTSLNPGQRVLVVKNIAAFQSRYGPGSLIAGEFTGRLENGGERVQLVDNSNEEILDFEYNNSWYDITDGGGFSLVIVNEAAIAEAWNDKTNWRPSGAYAGSPGTPDSDPVVVAPILVNEVLTHTDLPQVDWVELYNPTANDVNIGGWFLSDDFQEGRKYRILDNTIIPAGGYAWLTETNFNANPNDPASFSFSAKGDEVYLFSGNGTDLTGYVHGYDFGPAENGVSFGRHYTSQGEVHFVAQSAITPLATNAPPKVGPVVISEFMYHPPDLAGGADNENDEYIELHNTSGGSVTLNDAGPAPGWKFDGDVEFEFPNGTTLDSGQFLLVVNFDPLLKPRELAAFRTTYGLGTEVPIYGPYSGNLNNHSETITLYKPDAPEAGEVPYVRVDRVTYVDADPWPFAADGFGPSLVRNNEGAYGNDPANWRGVAPTPGAASGTGTFPIITSQPAGGYGIVGQNATLTVGADGSAPLRYQWRFNGNNLPGATSASLTLNNLKLSQAGVYNVAVFNDAGAVVSSNATLSVVVPATILAQPMSQSARLGSNVTFTVSAASQTPISYQWKKNGDPLPGKTESFLTLLDVDESDAGDYSVRITDAVSTIESAIAKLTILINPELIHLVTVYNVVTNGNITLSVESLGSQPMSYRWRRRFTNLKSEIAVNKSKSFFTVSNVTAAISGTSNNYSVVITNAASFTPGLQSTNIYLFILADLDHDKMPDVWETQYNLGVGDPTDAALDSDTDGMTNLEEYTAGTNPRDDTSFLKITKVTEVGPETYAVEFDAVSNTTYTIYYADKADSTTWLKLDDVVGSITNRTVTLLDTNGQPARFYRLITPRQE